jgi:hypothetical protein
MDEVPTLLLCVSTYPPVGHGLLPLPGCYESCCWEHWRSSYSNLKFKKILLPYCCCARVPLWHLQKRLQYILAEVTHPSWSSSSRLIVHFHTRVHSTSTIFALQPPCLTCPTPTGANPERDLFCPTVLPFCKRCFCLFRIAIQGVSVWHVHLIPFLWWFEQV